MNSEDVKEKIKEYEVSIEHRENNITLFNFKPTKEMTPKEAFDFLEEVRDYI